VDRDTVLWTLVVFFGASILFAAVRDATSDEGTGLSLLAQLGVGLLLVAAIVLFVRRRR
jgi:MYXO-CTERM domain-containing protein